MKEPPVFNPLHEARRQAKEALGIQPNPPVQTIEEFHADVLKFARENHEQFLAVMRKIADDFGPLETVNTMTKKVRIENADTNDDVGLAIEVWSSGSDGLAHLVSEQSLLYPTSMADIYIHKDAWIVVREIKK